MPPTTRKQISNTFTCNIVENAVQYKVDLSGMLIYNPDTNKLSVNISGKVYQTDGSETTAYSITKSNLAIYVHHDSGLEDTLVPQSGYSVSGATFNTTYLNNADYDSEDYFYFVLSVDGSDVARNTFMLVKNGEKGATGDDGVSYRINILTAEARVDASGVMRGDIEWQVIKNTGGVDSTIGVATGEHQLRLNTGSSWEGAGDDGNYTLDTDGLYDGSNWVSEGSPTSVEIRYLIGGNVRATEVVQFTIEGQRGKVGRFFYYGGVFNANDSSQNFIVNDAQAPYFKDSSALDSYHVFNYEANGTYTMAQMYAIQPSFAQAPWEIMTNDFKYLITQAIFTAFAKLGGFVISGNWMLSHYGTLYNSSGTAYAVNATSVTYTKDNAYTMFDSAYPDSSKSGSVNFCPTFAVDGASGEIYATNGHFKGVVTTTAMKSIDLNDGNHGDNDGFVISEGGSYIFDSDDSSYIMIPDGYVSITIETDNIADGTIITLMDRHQDAAENFYNNLDVPDTYKHINPSSSMLDIETGHQHSLTTFNSFAIVEIDTRNPTTPYFKGFSTIVKPYVGAVKTLDKSQYIRFQGGYIQLVKLGDNFRIINNSTEVMLDRQYGTASLSFDMYDGVTHQSKANMQGVYINGKQVENQYFN